MFCTPVRLSTYSVFFQVLPPSVLRYSPRLSLATWAFPSTAAITRFGSLGSTRMPGICLPSSNPGRCCHVLPASVDLYIPLPPPVLPVPTYTMSGSDGATSTAPIEEMSWMLSKTGYHVVQALVVFHTPTTSEETTRASS